MQQQMTMTNPGQPVHVIQQPNVGNRQPDGCCSLKGVAITELVLGILSFILSCAAVGVAVNSLIFGIYVSSPGIWGGVMLVALGSIGIAQTKQENQSRMHSGGIIFGIITCLTMVVAFGLSVACAYYSGYAASYFRLYYDGFSVLDVLVALHALLSIAVAIGFGLAVTHAVLSSSRNSLMQTQSTMMVQTQQYQIPVAGQQPPVYQQPFANRTYPTTEKAQQQVQSYENLGFSPQPTGQ